MTGSLFLPPRPDPSPSTYAQRWLGALAVDNVREDWHLDVIQGQFLDGEVWGARADFIARHTGRPTSGVSLSDRARVVARASVILTQHGRVPRVSAFWFPGAA